LSLIAVSPLTIRDRALDAFEIWLEKNKKLFQGGDEKNMKIQQRRLKLIRKEIKKSRGYTAVPELLGFALWAQNYLANLGVAFGMGIFGERVKSFHVTDPTIDIDSSDALAHALAELLLLQFA
jgi:hypothetical protein